MSRSGKNDGHVEALLRTIARAKRTRQVWIALTVIWGVVLGWITWGIVGSQTGDDLAAWLVYVVPLGVLASGAGVAHWHVRQADRELTAAS